MADLQTVPGARVAFSEYCPEDARGPGNELATLEGGILRAIRGKAQMCFELPADQSHFGYLESGALAIYCQGIGINIEPGFYFSIPGKVSAMCLTNCKGVVISRPDYHSFLQIGFLEYEGRLRYINGCTDSLLISPIKLGDPCLNLLYFPANTDQTMHTHPSDRIGMILSGGGICVTEDERGRVVTPLSAGMLFCIHAGGRHKFQTYAGPMRVLAYHPDSDFGPTDEDHPMINRTMVGGVSAKQLVELHTQTIQA